MDKAAFKEQMESGRKFERKVQTLLETHSQGQVFRNVVVGHVCEFDVVIEDYPLLTFIEIKRYRTDFAPERVRSVVTKFRKACVKVTTDPDQYTRQWLPYRNKRNEKERGEVTYFELLLNKLNLAHIDDWKFRMVLIVPDTAYRKVIDSLMGKFLPHHPTNIIDVDGIPLTVLRTQSIESTFG